MNSDSLTCELTYAARRGAQVDWERNLSATLMDGIRSADADPTAQTWRNLTPRRPFAPVARMCRIASCLLLLFPLLAPAGARAFDLNDVAARAESLASEAYTNQQKKVPD